MAQTTRASGANVEALRRWLEGQDAALEEWLDGTVRPIVRRRRTLALA